MSRVLVIEDDPGLARLMGEVLAEEGHAVEAATGMGAVARARAGGVDAIVLDLMMPGLDGWAVREALLGHPASREIPVVVVSAVPEGRRNDPNLYAAAVLRKPFSIGDLAAAVRRAVQQQ